MGFFWKRRSATLRPTGIQRSYMKRLNGVVSMIFTCTVEVRFSQMRGGANITWGPISRMFSITVSGCSGKFTVKPTASAEESDIICSPIQASGRKETNSSSGSLGSTELSESAMESRFRKESIAPLGNPVVPEV